MADEKENKPSATPNPTVGTASKPGAEPNAEVARIANLLGGGLWIWRLLIETKFWTFLIPWPLHHLKRLSKSGRANPARGSGWLTFGIVLWFLLARFSTVGLDSVERHYAADASKVLFSGAFLLGTILSVSVAMPGQAVMKAILADDPSFALDFVVPFVWAFLWGIAGAVLMFAFPGLHNIVPNTPPVVGMVLQAAATMIALYGALMELNALLHTVRAYTLGLIFMARDQQRHSSDRRTH